MKRKNTLLLIAAFLLLAYSPAAKSIQVIDANTVYAPKTNVCVSSFGGYIQSREIIIVRNAGERMPKAKALLIRWIYEFNYPGFYLQAFDASQYYWQFVETKKYLGAVLMVTGDSINPAFYESLGSGLNQPGHHFYGLATPETINGELFSFVINKQNFELDHFENWQFSEQPESPKQPLKPKFHKLLTETEYQKLKSMTPQTPGESANRHSAVKISAGSHSLAGLSMNDRKFVGFSYPFGKLH
ncbi:MAG: hypothetical protein HYZ14_15235 [Bacteroidetes bacterium]|nr:hypothetical protein [Bacteroidota bacterium]